MTSLGQIKALIDLQLLRGITKDHTANSKSEQKLDFSKLYQQTIASSINNMKTKDDQTFGHIYNAVLNHKVIIEPKNTITKTTSSIDLDEIIQKAAETYQLPVKLIKTVIKHESNFNPTAESHAGAQGLMQLMPATAKSLGVSDPFNPYQNVMGGSKYLRQMLDLHNGDLTLALASYNAGPGNVRKYGGIPPFKETEQYIRKIMSDLKGA